MRQKRPLRSLQEPDIGHRQLESRDSAFGLRFVSHSEVAEPALEIAPEPSARHRSALAKSLLRALSSVMANAANNLVTKAKKTASRSRAGSVIEIKRSGPTKARSKKAVFSYGSASLKTTSSPEEWARNVDLGRVAMKNLKAKLIKPGVRVSHAKSVPLFRADPAQPGRLIRTLNGKDERGAFVDGVFKVQA